MAVLRAEPDNGAVLVVCDKLSWVEGALGWTCKANWTGTGVFKQAERFALGFKEEPELAMPEP